MNSDYYEYLTTSAKNDPELNEHDKETVLAFLKRLDTNPDKYAVPQEQSPIWTRSLWRMLTSQPKPSRSST